MVRALTQEKRDVYLQTALSLFVRNGVTHTSTAEIAKNSGTATGTLFLYFPTKQDLLDEIVLNIGRQQSEHVKSLIEETQTTREVFLGIWEGTIHWFLENMDSYQFLQQVRDTGLISIQAVERSAMFFDYYYRAIQKGLLEGVINDYPLAMIGEFLYQDIIAAMNTLKQQPDASQSKQIIQHGFEIFWNGIRRPPETTA